MEGRAQASIASLIDSSDDYFWSVDLDYRLLTFNRAFAQHLESLVTSARRWAHVWMNCLGQSEARRCSRP
jgi:hypothetical protein